ncbi:hypothetical protein C4D60_Mb08t08730 [Musa balbisiana]|uniref:Uncharacterized protein n=1 Tax=Musa balbisiana TaxID=52838 RepID=A0A4S8K2C8_MUSBA|nr:hypothetical protein C4D60_Mb08t08730 [Musa balbisiana]
MPGGVAAVIITPLAACHAVDVTAAVTVRNRDVDVEASCLVDVYFNILDLNHLHLLLLLLLLAVLLRPCHDHPQRVARVECLGRRPEFVHARQRQLRRGFGLRLCRLLAVDVQPWERNLLERVPKLGRVEAVPDLHSIRQDGYKLETCLDFDELLVLVVEQEGAVQPVVVFELDAVAAEFAVDVPHAVDIAMVAEENRIAGGGGEVAHVFLVSVRLSDPHVRRIVDDFQLPVSLLDLLLPRAHGIPHEQLRQRQAVLERVVVDELAEDPLVEVEVVAVPGEEDPAEVDLDVHVVGIFLVVGVVAVLAVDVRLLVVVPRVVCRQILHPPHGLLVLVQILLIVLHEMGRPPDPEGRSGEAVLRDLLVGVVRRAAVVFEGRCFGIAAPGQIRGHYRRRQNLGSCGHAVKPS